MEIDYNECLRMITHYWYLRKMPVNEEKIHDLAVKLFYYQDRFDGRGIKNYWLASIARFFVQKAAHTAMIAKRRKHSQQITEEHWESIEDKKTKQSDDFWEDLSNVELTDVERAIIKLKYEACWTFKKIAEKLGVSPQRVERMEKMILEKIRERLVDV